jgi:hypothetical protein
MSDGDSGSDDSCIVTHDEDDEIIFNENGLLSDADNINKWLEKRFKKNMGHFGCLVGFRNALQNYYFREVGDIQTREMTALPPEQYRDKTYADNLEISIKEFVKLYKNSKIRKAAPSLMDELIKKFSTRYESTGHTASRLSHTVTHHVASRTLKHHGSVGRTHSGKPGGISKQPRRPTTLTDILQREHSSSRTLPEDANERLTLLQNHISSVLFGSLQYQLSYKDIAEIKKILYDAVRKGRVINPEVHWELVCKYVNKNIEKYIIRNPGLTAQGLMDYFNLYIDFFDSLAGMLDTGWFAYFKLNRRFKVKVCILHKFVELLLVENYGSIRNLRGDERYQAIADIVYSSMLSFNSNGLYYPPNFIDTILYKIANGIHNFDVKYPPTVATTMEEVDGGTRIKSKKTRRYKKRLSRASRASRRYRRRTHRNSQK